MAERDDQELLKKFPLGSEDPEVAKQLRQARERLSSGEKRGYVIGHDGRVYTEEQYRTMSPAEKRGVCVGSTCTHYESDVPGMDDTDLRVGKKG